MKKTILLFILSAFSLITMAQSAPTTVSTSIKKTVQIDGKWYIETTDTYKSYTELNLQLLLKVEDEDQQSKQDDDEVLRIQAQRDKKKAERIEHNKLLREAIRKGYKPEATTIQELEKIKKINAKLGIK